MSKWARVTRSKKCPICGHDTWCLVSPDRSAVLCMRDGTGREKKLKDGSIGYIHRLGAAVAHRVKDYAPPTADEITLDVDKILRRYAMDTTPAAVAELAALLSVSPESLTRLEIAWSRRHRAWAFPMRIDVEGFWEACGVRLRGEKGKWAIKGSHPGLFVPTGLHGVSPLLVCEGPTDTAAMLSLGFDAVGRPSSSGSMDQVRKFVKAGGYRDVVIVSDTDVPGRLGAAQLALEVTGAKIIVPTNGKDARAWKQSGATKAMVMAVINNTRRPDRRQLQELVKDLQEQARQRSLTTSSKTDANAAGTKPGWRGSQSGKAVSSLDGVPCPSPKNPSRRRY